MTDREPDMRELLIAENERLKLENATLRSQLYVDTNGDCYCRVGEVPGP